MPKILVATVGGSPQPIANAIKQNSPDFVYLLCSSGESGSDKTIEEATYVHRRGECPHCKKTFDYQDRIEPVAKLAGISRDNYEIVTVQNHDDIGEVVTACESVGHKLKARFPQAYNEVIANYTGGTKTMTLGLGIHALDNGWALQLQAGRRIDLLKVRQGDVALLQDLSSIKLRDVLASAQERDDNFQYEDAVSILTFALVRTNLRPTDQSIAQAWRSLYRLLAARDRFDYKEALAILENEPLPEGVDGAKLLSELKALKGAARRMESEEIPKRRDTSIWLILEDLIHNAERCARRGRYDDAAARLYRATELLAQIQLLRNFEIKTSNVDTTLASLPASTREWLQLKGGSVQVGQRPIQIGLYDSYRLLNELNDPLGEFWQRNKADLKDVIEYRNRSYLAHGYTVIDEDTWQPLGGKWLAWLSNAKNAALSIELPELE